MLALTRPVPRRISECELTNLERQPIDWRTATEQHGRYEAALRSLGCEVHRLAGDEARPDSVFIEDTAVVLDEHAVITRPGAESRRAEVDVVADALARYRAMSRLEQPGTLDGGDVLRVGRHLYVGLSSRTNTEGASQLADIASRFGYTTKAVSVRDCLHLKTAVSVLPDDRLLLNPSMVDPASFDGAPWLEIDPSEPFAANVVSVNDKVLCAASAPRTRARLETQGHTVLAIDASELAKAEGGLTCCSLILRTAI